MKRRFDALLKRGLNGPEKIHCVLVTREQVDQWLPVRHLGEQGGVGLVGWGAAAKDRYNRTSPKLQVLEKVRASGFLPPDMVDLADRDFNLTTVSRLLGNPRFRKSIGLQVAGGHVSFLTEESVARMALVLGDIANGDLPVTSVYTAKEGADYGQRVFRRPLPIRRMEKRRPPTSASAKIAAPIKRLKKRRTLIPEKLSLEISESRIEDIFDELKRLNLASFTNSVSVLFRVFVEMSVGVYAEKHGIPLAHTSGKNNSRGNDRSLRELMKAVENDLVKRGVCSEGETDFVRQMTATKNHIFTVGTWNQYVHNLNVHPAPEDLRAWWDSIQPFVVGMYSD